MPLPQSTHHHHYGATGVGVPLLPTPRRPLRLGTPPASESTHLGEQQVLCLGAPPPHPRDPPLPQSCQLWSSLSSESPPTPSP